MSGFGRYISHINLIVSSSRGTTSGPRFGSSSSSGSIALRDRYILLLVSYGLVLARAERLRQTLCAFDDARRILRRAESLSRGAPGPGGIGAVRALDVAPQFVVVGAQSTSISCFVG